jgi:hypothetical protein
MDIPRLRWQVRPYFRNIVICVVWFISFSLDSPLEFSISVMANWLGQRYLTPIVISWESGACEKGFVPSKARNWFTWYSLKNETFKLMSTNMKISIKSIGELPQNLIIQNVVTNLLKKKIKTQWDQLVKNVVCGWNLLKDLLGSEDSNWR